MPAKVTKQSAKPKKLAKKGSGVVDRIQPVGTNTPSLRVTIYGRSKTGKTRLVCTFPKPMLLIGTEDGTLSVSTIKGVDFVQIQSSSELEELVELLRTGKYKTVALDHAGNLQDMILKEVLGLEDMPIQKSFGMAQRSDWSTCAIQTKERLRSLLTLAETDSIDVAIVAHERNFSDDNDTSGLIFPTVGAALTPSVTNWLSGATDYICQTFIREETIEKPTKVGGKIVTTSRNTGKQEYCLRVGPHPVFMTGFRLPPGIELPECIVDPSYSKIMKLVEGKS